jgi:tetratricopeptide (TPR) repeat protein
MAAAAKELGNAHFKAGEYDLAVQAFSDAIKLDSSDAVFWSNRSGAYLKLGKGHEARADALKAVELKPDWWKAWNREAAADEFLGRWADAEKAYAKAEELMRALPGGAGPNLDSVQEGLARARQKVQAEAEQKRKLEQMPLADLEKQHVAGLQKLSLEELHAECAALKVKAPAGATREKLIELLSKPDRGSATKTSALSRICPKRSSPVEEMSEGQKALQARKKRMMKLNQLTEKQLVKILVRYGVTTRQSSTKDELVNLIIQEEDERRIRGSASSPQWIGIAMFSCVVLIAFLGISLGFYLMIESAEHPTEIPEHERPYQRPSEQEAD